VVVCYLHSYQTSTRLVHQLIEMNSFSLGLPLIILCLLLLLNVSPITVVIASGYKFWS